VDKFVHEEIDVDTLPYLTEEHLEKLVRGVTSLPPRMRVVVLLLTWGCRLRVIQGVSTIGARLRILAAVDQLRDGACHTDHTTDLGFL
jgi:uncharacterized protein with ACT and thioredoxin-like domain